MAEIEGLVVELLPERNGISEKTNKEWRSREFILEYGEPPHIKKGIFSLFGDKIDSVNFGERVKVSFNPEANEWQGRYFCKNSVWRIDILQSVATKSTSQVPTAQKQAPTVADLPSFSADDQDLSF